MSMDPSPFLPQTTIAIEKVKIAANEAQPKVKIISLENLLDYNLLNWFENVHLQRN